MVFDSFVQLKMCLAIATYESGSKNHYKLIKIQLLMHYGLRWPIIFASGIDP